MGRFLDIARDTESAIPLPVIMPPIDLAPLLIVTPQAAAALPFDAPASAVLRILAQADQPVPHPEIIRRMIAAGHDKTAAKQAIARCQKRRWIEHNLETGYVLR